MIPVAAVFENDFVAQLVVVDEEDTMEVVAQKIAHHAVGLRVKPEDRRMEILVDGRVIPQEKTVKEAGITPMDLVVARYV
ncbi:toluene-4-monooxygenase system B family protein [Kyrpidia spormannii]|uniref:Toluene-4-monooxygenase system, hydroxylase component subunit gamma n=2 Tax=Kyrpidia spormannii TaxID=2055160 RepID=A0ACA8ZAF7_9BACL|nr:toluene-4-monooxygenase system B family protein [Kyrpidia spormannii]CAB3393603.1 Toluene-4-monooxygenase system, hydroxylase component subunit gamma [Kyrpidia spormannii]CAB3394525.1 Toluene-4-monooxygenase system, hydroxylase component subunit gamma [Kyrpidia spormannii]